MITKYSNKLVWLLFLITEFCFCEDQYSLVIKMSSNICIMLVYIDNQDHTSNYQDIVAKTHCAFIATDNFKKEMILDTGITNLKKQLLETKITNHINFNSIVVGFFDNYPFNKQAQKTKQPQIEFVHKLHYYLDIHAFNHDVNNIIIVDDHELLVQLTTEYLYKTQNIYKKLINSFLVADINNQPKYIEIITNQTTKKPMNVIVHNNPINFNNYNNNNISFICANNGIVESNDMISNKEYSFSSKQKLILINSNFLGYNIYSLKDINDTETILISAFKKLIYTDLQDEYNDFKNNYLQQITHFCNNNINVMHSIVNNNKLDYIIVTGEFLISDMFHNIYLQQLKTRFNINQDKIHIITQENFYVNLIAAAKTIAKQFNKKLNANFTSVWDEYSDKTKKYPIVDQPITNKINSMINTIDDITDPYTFNMIDENLDFNLINPLNRETLPDMFDINYNDNLVTAPNNQIDFNAEFINEYD